MPAQRIYNYDPDRIRDAAPGSKSLSQLAMRLEIEPTSFTKFLARNPDLKEEVLELIGGHYHPNAEDRRQRVQFEDVADLGDIQSMLERRGLDVAQWSVTRARVNEWGAGVCTACDTPVEPLRQLRVDLDPRGDVLVPARPDGPAWPSPREKKLKAGDRVAFLADPHAPYEDAGALDAFRLWLERTGPVERIVILGDVLDLPGPSRHRSMPGEPSSQDCLEAAYGWLRAVRAAAPDAQIDWLAGNHDARISLYALDQARDLHSIHQVNGGPAALSLTWLLRLDELAINLHHHEQGWEMGELEITPSLSAWHAPPSKRQQDVIRYSVIHAHHHAQSWSTVPILDQRNATVGRRMIVGAGTMADFRTGLGYAKSPGWTQGWCWADLWDDGEHEIAHVRYRDRTAWWPGGRLKVR